MKLAKPRTLAKTTVPGVAGPPAPLPPERQRLADALGGLLAGLRRENPP